MLRVLRTVGHLKEVSPTPKISNIHFNNMIKPQSIQSIHSSASLHKQSVKNEEYPSPVILPHSEPSTDKVLLIPPNDHTGFNKYTATDNFFMKEQTVSKKIIEGEFNNVVEALKKNRIKVVVPTPSKDPTPDCIFPNNWLSTHHGHAIIYPMKAENRRLEIRQDILLDLEKAGIISRVHDWTHYTKEEMFLEGTGALVLDRVNQYAFINISQRCHPTLAIRWCNAFNYNWCLFESRDENDKSIYHTNVIMAVGSTYAIVCLEAIKGQKSRENLIEVLNKKCHKEIIEISLAQLHNYCGNCLELKGNVLVMSERAKNHFTKEQLSTLANDHKMKIVAANIENIENIMGGSIRCMICELF